MSIKSTARTALNLSLFTGFVLTHPVVGVVAQPILAVKATVHAISLNYHWRHTKNAQGIALNRNDTPSYMDRTTKFTAEDLTRLRHQQKRLDSRYKLSHTLKNMRGLAKCIIPVGGLLWFASSIDDDNKKFDGKQKTLQNEKNALMYHIHQLEQELKCRNVSVLT
ncbi:MULTISPECIES: hypothetical protein [Parachlamydia]|jgi:hypothetical protein|uniref:hypothetical protein n=1 Tax=Parachlamydia TaxID=83551 RepID=UPI0001C1766F|nr:hypothetical protein [Parachlamydia acanthamoebae]EFB42228.1 hypothetical protein pah_c014o172 [Parachlamydia acanthamoebae str. Hall's coccus]